MTLPNQSYENQINNGSENALKGSYNLCMYVHSSVGETDDCQPSLLQSINS